MQTVDLELTCNRFNRVRVRAFRTSVRQRVNHVRARKACESGSLITRSVDESEDESESASSVAQVDCSSRLSGSVSRSCSLRLGTRSGTLRNRGIICSETSMRALTKPSRSGSWIPFVLEEKEERRFTTGLSEWSPNDEFTFASCSCHRVKSGTPPRPPERKRTSVSSRFLETNYR